MGKSVLPKGFTKSRNIVSGDETQIVGREVDVYHKVEEVRREKPGKTNIPGAERAGMASSVPRVL